MQPATLLKTTRPSFLILTPACVFLGLGSSLATGSHIDTFILVLILIGAITAHISVNALNEYYDFRSGLDFKTQRTAFSGGSGALPGRPEMANMVLVMGLISLLVTIIIGIYFIIERGTLILPLGIAGVLLIITYTQWINRYPILCLIAPGSGFGILMVLGTHVLLTGELSWLPLIISLVPFFLINNLLLLNQYPDMQADASTGRHTFPIAYGIEKSNLVYAVFSLAAYSLILICIVKGYLPVMGVIALGPSVFSLLALYGAKTYKSEIGSFPLYLGANVAAAIVTPILVGISIIYG